VFWVALVTQYVGICQAAPSSRGISRTAPGGSGKTPLRYFAHRGRREVSGATSHFAPFSALTTAEFRS
jgi:hypothetical protein